MLIKHFGEHIKKAEDEAREAMKEGKITIWDMGDIVGLSTKYEVLVEREVLRRLEDKCGCRFKWPELYQKEMP